ncbi:MAG: hypothetical protein ACR2NQ_05185 [Thermodesulfobacteriota bacterium]
MKLKQSRTYKSINHKDVRKQFSLRHLKFHTTRDIEPSTDFIKFPAGTVNSVVEETLERFSLEYRRFGKEEDEDKSGRED